ncbi:MAG: glycosyltransferase family 39 protein [Leptospiraceae bacterium]|nr:glycosyltransferase family 39 protein [Leptospiraceae bacterium]MCK6381288.1 glycosyltransferase family 39 protein [Leptospiraceae bacterium]NUM40399.1 glycosyltransferase family 39 protein [Leptospiraceae bacterium]
MKFFYTFALIISILISFVSIFAFVDLGYDILRLKVNFGHFEDTSIHEIFRILEGGQLYSTPSIEYIPLLYGPVYFYLSIPFAILFGKSFLAGRAISILSTLVIFLLTYFLIRKMARIKTGQTILFTIISIGLFVSANEIFDFWLYTAKVDALFLLFLVLAYLFFLYSEKNEKYLYVSSVFSSFLFFTKQNGILLPFFILLYLALLKEKKRFILFGSMFSLISVILFLFFYLHSGEKFITFFLSIPSSHPLLWKKYSPELFQFFTPFLGAILVFLVAIIGNSFKKEKIQNFGNTLFWKFCKQKKNAYPILFLVSLFSISFLGRMKVGAVGNSWIYFVFSLSVFFSIFIHRFSKAYFRRKKNVRYFVYSAVLFLFLFLQFTVFSYNYFSQKKFIANLKENENETIQTLCGYKTPLLFPFAGYLPEMLCRNESIAFQQQSVLEIIRNKKEYNQFISRYKAALESGYYKTIIHTSSVPMEKTEEGLKLIDMQLQNAKTEKQKQDLLSFRSILEINTIILKNYKNIQLISKSPMIRLRFFGGYYLCTLE